MELRVMELDERGLIPWDFESEEDFLKRGNRTLWAAKELLDSQIIDKLQERVGEEYRFFPSTVDPKMIDYCLQYIKSRYGSDLSWVRFVDMVPRHPVGIMGLARGKTFVWINEIEGNKYIFPVVGLFGAGKRTVRHELIHIARRALSASEEFEGSNSFEFEQAVAENKYFESSFLNLDWRLKVLHRIRRKLQEFFDNNHGYVFTRLEYAELVENILSPNPLWGNPIEYIQRFSASRLKYWIIKKRLAL